MDSETRETRTPAQLLSDWLKAHDLTLEAFGNREGVTRQRVWQWTTDGPHSAPPDARRCARWATGDDEGLRAVGRAFMAQHYEGLRVTRAPAPASSSEPPADAGQ